MEEEDQTASPWRVCRQRKGRQKVPVSERVAPVQAQPPGNAAVVGKPLRNSPLLVVLWVYFDRWLVLTAADPAAAEDVAAVVVAQFLLLLHCFDPERLMSLYSHASGKSGSVSVAGCRHHCRG